MPTDSFYLCSIKNKIVVRVSNADISQINEFKERYLGHINKRSGLLVLFDLSALRMSLSLSPFIVALSKMFKDIKTISDLNVLRCAIVFSDPHVSKVLNSCLSLDKTSKVGTMVTSNINDAKVYLKTGIKPKSSKK